MPIAIIILLNGIDDVFVDLVCIYDWVRRSLSKDGRHSLTEKEFREPPLRRLAIYIPCWHEHGVIAAMIEHNSAAINYPNYDFFIGAYPNDDPTIEAVRKLEQRFRNVHLAVCPHDGPTSKADCLNWIYQRMLLFEEDHSTSFALVITHDAEDLIHPDSLSRFNYYGARYDFVQIPVFALKTPFRMIAHGVYCDEFTESQVRDMRARAIMGSFIPSAGVGTGYSRAALEKLADTEHNRIFEPACLTEDYENGMRLHRLGCSQIFVSPMKSYDGLLATREYFPTKTRPAIRQRSRWIMGIALQTWERHGWRGTPAQQYWFWRDRKGLVGNPVSLLANLVFLYIAGLWTVQTFLGVPWEWKPYRMPFWVLYSSLVLVFVHVGWRMLIVSRFYGWLFALGVPVRMVWANLINACATVLAVYRYTRARLRKEPLVWVKTEHAYPSRTALVQHKRKLGEILVGSGYVDERDLDLALTNCPAGVRLGEYLVSLGKLSEDDLYEALSLQQSLPSGTLRPSEISNKVARSLPRQLIHELKVLPYRVAEGSMFLASPEIPTDALAEKLRGFTRMSLRFQLVTPTNFKELTTALL